MNKTSLLTFLVFAICILLLSIQAPFFFHDVQSADTVYHAAKIVKVLGGSLFTDPFTGTHTLYPPLFHLIGASLALFLTPIATIHVLGVLTFALLAASLFFLGYSVFQNSKQASLFALLFSFIVYAPAAKYSLLQGPATFSHPLVFFGMGFMFSYRHSKKLSSIYTSALSLSLACQIWWFNLFFAPVFFVFSLMLMQVPKKECRLAAFFFAIPFLFTLFHLYSIQDVLFAYGSEKREVLSLLDFFKTFFLRGQGDYLETLPPWKWSYDHTEYSMMKTFRDVINFSFFFLIALPGALFMFFAALFLFFTKKDLPFFTRSLFILFMASFFFSMALTLMGNSAHLYRVQLYSHTLLLLFLIQTIPVKRGLIILGSVFTIWHVLHNPLTIGKSTSIRLEDQDVAKAIESFSDKRLFFTDTSYRSLITLTPFYSLVGNGDGRYYFQDPQSAARFKAAYENIVQIADWKKALADFDIKILGFNKLDPQESILQSYYAEKGEIVYENPKWILIKHE